MTSVIHRYLLDGQAVKASVTRDYRNQLREQWQIRYAASERQKHSRIYLGKPMELLVAQDLEHAGVSIVDLEATGGPCDIVALRNEENLFVEVKFIGTDDATFLAIENSFSTGGVTVGFGDPYSASDYLLSRLFEAAKQLEKVNGRRLAVVVIDDYVSWPSFQFGLKHNFIDWESPVLFAQDERTRKHLNKLRTKHPHLDEEISRLSEMVNDIRIYRLLEEYKLEVKFERTDSGTSMHKT